MRKIGYARLSFEDSDITPQINALTSFGCEEIFHDNKVPIAEDYSELDKTFKALKPGDSLVVCKLDKLGKSTKQLAELTHSLKERKIHFISLKEQIDTETEIGEKYLQLMFNLSDMEATLIRERTLIGLEEARKKGKVGGRPKISPKTVNKIRRFYFEEKQTIQYISNRCNVSVGSVYKYINLTERELEELFTQLK